VNATGAAAKSLPAAFKAVVKLVASIGCIALALGMVDRAQLSALLTRARPSWLALGIAISAAIYAAQAWRWSFIARRLRLRLSFREAWLECYLGALLNQTLPTGYAGESVRVYRLTQHNRDIADRTPRALLTVVLDRLSGQWVLWTSIGLTVPLWVNDTQIGWFACGAAIVAASASLVLVRHPLRLLPRRLVLDAPAYLPDIAQAVLSRGAWAVQLTTSIISVFGCLAMYFCALRALSVKLDVTEFLRVAPLMLAATSLPISFAGWGPREIASAALFVQIGLSAESGTAASIVYGLLSLASSLPGVLAWWRR
jgi:uncharacterized membrane protein YbhN (UPF0104 family)